MTQDPNAKARPTLADILKMPEGKTHFKAGEPTMVEIFEQRFQAALTEARNAALEEAIAVCREDAKKMRDGAAEHFDRFRHRQPSTEIKMRELIAARCAKVRKKEAVRLISKLRALKEKA